MRKSTNCVLAEYFEALERLKNGSAKIVPMGTKITNDAVAIEAGRAKGSIKKSRPSFSLLIEKISDAAATQTCELNQNSYRLKLSEEQKIEYKTLYEQALARELSLLHEIYTLRKQLSRLTGVNVFPLRPKNVD